MELDEASNPPLVMTEVSRQAAALLVVEIVEEVLEVLVTV
jgi:hypothetical protein